MTPFAILGLEDDASPVEVRARWRELASEHHPDRGGDAALFHSCRQAFEEAMRIAEQPKPCPACHGEGKIGVRRGFNQIMVSCSSCRGSGTR